MFTEGLLCIEQVLDTQAVEDSPPSFLPSLPPSLLSFLPSFFFFQLLLLSLLTLIPIVLVKFFSDTNNRN